MTSLPTIRKRRKRWNLFFLALPLMLMVLAFRYAPLFGWYLSLVDYKVGQPIFKSRFVGLYFFKMLFTSRDMSRIMRNSIILSALKTVSLVLPPVFAILLNELNNSRFRKFAQTTTTLPHFVSWVIVYSIAYALFTSDGIVNQLLGLFGKSQKLLTNKNAVYGFQTGIWIWKNLGWKSIIYVAAIAGIDQGLYEAATVDGANRFQNVLHVTIPGLAPTIIIMLILQLGNILSVGYEKIILLYNPLIYDTSDVILSYVYRMGFESMDWSYSTAVGLFNSVVNFVIIILANTISRKVSDTSLW